MGWLTIQYTDWPVHNILKTAPSHWTQFPPTLSEECPFDMSLSPSVIPAEDIIKPADEPNTMIIDLSPSPDREDTIVEKVVIPNAIQVAIYGRDVPTTEGETPVWRLLTAPTVDVPEDGGVQFDKQVAVDQIKIVVVKPKEGSQPIDDKLEIFACIGECLLEPNLAQG